MDLAPRGRERLDERFTGNELDRDIWLPYYLPHWSSRAESAATYEVRGGALRLSIPPDQGLWCAETHDEPLRVSCVQSGNFSGPVGSTVGAQPFREGLVVSEEQPQHRGYIPRYGHVEVTMRGTVGPRSMFAFWMSGIEDIPERSGELCVAEIFGSDVGQGTANVGIGIHRFRDPDLKEEFSTVPLEIDVSADHTYAVDWRPDSVSFAVDGITVRTSQQSPDYPMQLMIGVFDFPNRPGPEEPAPEMVVSAVVGSPVTGPG